MLKTDWKPGDYAAVKPSTLVDRWGTGESSYTRQWSTALIVHPTHQWLEPDGYLDTDPVHRYYLVYLVGKHFAASMLHFSNSGNGLYSVPGHALLEFDEVNNPGRFFGRLVPIE